MTTGTKPYLLRALYKWYADDGQMPHIVAWVNEHTRASMQYVRENGIVLDIGPTASHNLNIDNEWVSFSTRLNGVAHGIWIPVGHVVNILARESEEGMGFEVEPYQPENIPTREQIPQSESKDTESAKPRKGLRLVK